MHNNSIEKYEQNPDRPMFIHNFNKVRKFSMFRSKTTLHHVINGMLS